MVENENLSSDVEDSSQSVEQSPDVDDSPTLHDSVLRAATRTIQLSLLGLVVYTAVIGEMGLVVNTAIMFFVSLIPDIIHYWYDLRSLPVVAFLVALAPLLHVIGAMGLYRNVAVFDQFAHSVSAMVVAGFGYVIVRVIDMEYDRVEVPPKLRFVFVLIFATSFGVFWEILEFGTGLLSSITGGEPLLAQYGPNDVVLDLLFNTVGAVIVALWGTSYFTGLRRMVTQRFYDE